MRVVLAGGGTGGHIFPLVSVYQELQTLAEERHIPLEVLFIGHINDQGKATLEKYEIPYKLVYAGKWRRYPSFWNVLDIFRGLWGLTKAQWYMWTFMPDVTFGKGGYASVPAGLVAALYRIPLIIHESDSQPGAANRILAKVATQVAVAFPSAKQHLPAQKTSVIGNMTRPDISEGSKEEARTIFDLTYEKPVLLIIGGSQGAKALNQTVWKSLSELIQRVELIHVVGEAHVEEAERIHKGLGTYEQRLYHYAGFLRDELKHAYAAADIVLSRAGASSLADIARNQKPSILVPLSVDAGQQRGNAYDFAEVGASIVIEEPNLTSHVFMSKIDEVLNDADLLKQMRESSAQFAGPNTAKTIAQQIIDLAV